MIDQTAQQEAGIYLICNLVNQKVYVGSSINLRKRMFEHVAALRRDKHVNPHLQAAYNCYGENSFSFQVLELTDYLFDRESHFIALFDSLSRDCGYNLASDHRAPFRGRCHSVATKEKMSQKRRGYRFNTEDRIRRFVGDKNPRAKLSRDDVMIIKKALKTENTSQADLAERFMVSHKTISAIATGQNWSHVIV
jgi:group I intron endonuclease